MWKTVKLGVISEVITKGTTPTSVGFKFEDEGINFVKVESLALDSTFIPSKFAKINHECNKALKRSQLREGDILFSIAGALGRTAIVTKDILPANTNQALAIIRLKPEVEIDTKFLLYLLNSENTKEQSDREKGGTAQQNLSLTQLKNYDIALPPLAEQQRIVAKLDKAFAEIDKAVESSRCALRHADLLLVKVIETATSSVEHSQIVKVADVSDMQSGYGFKSGDYSDDATDVPLLRGDNIAPNYIDLSSAKRLPVKLAADYKRFELQTEDVILAMDRPYISTGLRLAKINESHMPCLLVQRVMRLRAEPKLNPDFLHLAMETPRFLDHILGNQTGLGVPHISGKTIGSFEFEIPSLEQQARIVSDVSAAKEQIKFLRLSHERRIDELINLRSALLAQELQPPQSEAA